MTENVRYRIHPAIGIARVGNAPASEYFLGPELPNQRAQRAPDTGTAVPPFKSDGRIKRQAVRFRVFEFVRDAGQWTVSREVSLADGDVAELTWTVHLANRKASFFEFHGLDGSPDGAANTKRRNNGDPANLEIDPLPRSIGGRSAGPVEMSKGTSDTPAQERWPNPAPDPDITTLGELRTDQVGRLIVVPGAGIVGKQRGATISNYANNPGCFDDVGDGPVSARLKLRAPDGTVTEHDAEDGWLVVGPPDFAPPLPQLVSLYDVLLDVAVRELPIPPDEPDASGELSRLSGLAGLVRDLQDGTALSSYTVSFDTDVAPILRAAFGVSSVFEPAHQGKRNMGGLGISPVLWKQLSDPAHPGVPGRIVAHLHPPAGFDDGAADDTGRDMPHLLGDDPNNAQQKHRVLTLTPTQYAIMRKWADGVFIGSALGPESLLDPPPAQDITPHGLDRAATECASGGAFFPGIEVGWLARQLWVFAAPFRIKHGAPSRYNGDQKESQETVAAGFFSRQMALPWLADFLQCMHEDDGWGWWPSQRPDSVQAQPEKPVPWHRSSGPDGVPKPWPEAGIGLPARDEDTPSYREMLDNWHRFGFVMPTGDGRFGETERAENIP
jgi:hypothetical protein